MAYEIFISFKNSFEGKPTKDREIANILYEQLYDLGFSNIFFSNRELETKANSEYSHEIERALDESSVLIFICTNPSYLESTYVKYEWSSFLTEINCGRKQGNIYGVIENINIDELPYSLRGKEIFAFNDLPLLFNFLKHDTRLTHLNKSLYDIFYEHNNKQFKKYAYRDRKYYERESFNEFFNLIIKGANRLGVVKYVRNCGVSTNIYQRSKALSLNNEINLAYFNDLKEISLFLTKIILNTYTDEFIFVIDKITTVNEAITIKEYLDTYTNLSFIVGINDEYVETIKVLSNDSIIFNYGQLDIDETQNYIKIISQKLNLPHINNLISLLLLPTFKELRTPYMLELLLNNFRELTNYKESDYNITDIFDVFEKYFSRTNHRYVELLELIFEITLKKGFNIFTPNEISSFHNEVEELIDLGFIIKNGVCYAIANKEYFNYRIALTIFNNQCFNCDQNTFRFFKDSLPYYVYLCYIQTSITLYDLFPTDDNNIIKTLQLFVSEETTFEQILLTRLYDKEIIILLKRFRKSGLFSQARVIIELYKKNNIKSCEELDYLSEELMMYYYETGNIIPITEQYGSIAYHLGYIYYCIDHQDEAGKYFEIAYKQMIEAKEVKLNLIFDYIEYLLDLGKKQKIYEILAIYENSTITKQDEYLINYNYLKSVISVDMLDLDLAEEYIKKAIRINLQNVNLKTLQIYYGQLGKVNLYMGRLEEAKVYIKRNLEISMSLSDFNGMAIASKDYGKIAFLQNDFKEAIKYFSYSKTYAQKAHNLWRYTEACLYLSLFIEDFYLELANILTTALSINSKVFTSEAYPFVALSYYLHNDYDKAMVYINKGIEDSLIVDNSKNKASSEAVISLIKDERYLNNSSYTTYVTKWLEEIKLLKNSTTCYIPKIPFYLFSELSSNRLILRTINMKDANNIFDYTSDELNTKYVMWRTHNNIQDVYNYIQFVYNVEHSGDLMTWAIYAKNFDKVIGTIDLNYNDNLNEVEIGYIINSDYWNKGFATEACRLVIDYCKLKMPFKTIIGIVFKVNLTSRHLLEKLGFSFVKEIPNYHANSLVSDKTGCLYRLNLDK